MEGNAGAHRVCLVLAALVLLALVSSVYGSERVPQQTSRLGKRMMMRTLNRNKYHLNNVADGVRFAEMRHRLGGRHRQPPAGGSKSSSKSSSSPSKASSSGDKAPADLCKTNPCDPHAVCVSTGPGTYTCACSPGFKGNGHVCSELNPCDGKPCGPPDIGICESSGPGKYKCDCPKGWHLNGDQCKKKIDHTVERQFHAAQKAVDGLEKVEKDKIHTLADIGRQAQVEQLAKDVAEVSKVRHHRKEEAQNSAIHEVEDRVNEVTQSVEDLAEQTKEQGSELDKIAQASKREDAVQKVLQLANIASLSSGGGGGAAAVAAAAAAMDSKKESKEETAGGAEAGAATENGVEGSDGGDTANADNADADDASAGDDSEEDTTSESTRKSILTAAALGAFRPPAYPSANYQPQNPPAPSPHRLPSGVLQRPGPVSVYGAGPTGRLGRGHFDSDYHIRVVYPNPGLPQQYAVPAEGQFIEPEMRTDD